MVIDGLPVSPGPGGDDADRAQELERLRRENARLGEQFEEAERQLAGANHELNGLAGRIAHDLQAVMQVTEGFATALQRSAAQKLADKERHYLQRIVETSARGSSMIADLQAYAHLRTQPVKFAPVDLGQLVLRAQRAVAPLSQGRQVEWALDALPAVWGDAPLLEQVLVHLFSNALKFTRGKEPARIWVHAASVQAGYELRVQDNGVGFDPAYAERLFRPFERLHGAQYEGNGMGLAKVRRIVERHGGTASAAIVHGGGVVVAFTLQAMAADTPAAPRPEPAADAGPAAQGPAALRVLLIDDDPMVLLSLRNMLEADGHIVGTAAGGQIGVDAFGQSLREGQGFDVVVTDFGMPHLDGREVARLVKQASPATRVIMLTGWQRPEGIADWKAHVDALLSKPPRLAQLREALAQAQAGTA